MKVIRALQNAIGRKSAFRYPIGPPPRTAVLVDWFDSSGPRAARLQAGNPVRSFTGGWTLQAAAFAPAALAGTREQLLSLAAQPPRLTHALVVLARAGNPLTSVAERDRLWRAFAVPVFEQIIGQDGELLAGECEAHDGLHVYAAGRAWEAYWIETAGCACGRKSPRLHALQSSERQRAAAAYAR